MLPSITPSRSSTEACAGSTATRSQVKYLQVLEDSVGYEGYQKLLELLEKIASHYEVGVSHIATKYILGRPSVACTIVGVRNSHHVADNCKIFGFELSPEDEAAITASLDGYPRLQGDCYTLERESPRYKSIIHMNVNEEEQGGNDPLASE